jgi:hypothetical protein
MIRLGPFAELYGRLFREGAGRDAWLARERKAGRHPGPLGRGWHPAEFAAACGVTVRTERNWRTGAVLPEDNIEGIAQVFYPDAAAERERVALRHALSEDQRQRREAPASNIPNPGLCLGRDAEIARLAGALMTSPGGSTVLVLGGPGYGKTTLTEKVSLHPEVISHFGARRWFIELDTVHTAPGILAEVAASVGMERTAQRPAVLSQLGEKPGLGLAQVTPSKVLIFAMSGLPRVIVGPSLNHSSEQPRERRFQAIHRTQSICCVL